MVLETGMQMNSRKKKESLPISNMKTDMEWGERWKMESIFNETARFRFSKEEEYEDLICDEFYDPDHDDDMKEANRLSGLICLADRLMNAFEKELTAAGIPYEISRATLWEPRKLIIKE